MEQPLKTEVAGLKMVYTAAKAAASLPQIIDTPPSPEAVLQKTKNQLLMASTAPPSEAITTRLMGTHNPEDRYKALAKLTRPDAAAVAQIRAGGSAY